MEWRMTMQSGALASRFLAVSSSVSPLLTLELDGVMLTASADKRLAAISNEVRVRVEGSKKRFITVRPRKVGTFFTCRREISRKVSAVSRILIFSPAESSRMSSKAISAQVQFIVQSYFGTGT